AWPRPSRPGWRPKRQWFRSAQAPRRRGSWLAFSSCNSPSNEGLCRKSGEPALTAQGPAISRFERACRLRVGLRQIAGRNFVHAAVGRAAFQNESPVAIAAVDEAFFVDLHVDPRVPQRGRAIVGAAANVAGTVAPYA